MAVYEPNRASVKFKHERHPGYRPDGVCPSGGSHAGATKRIRNASRETGRSQRTGRLRSDARAAHSDQKIVGEPAHLGAVYAHFVPLPQ